MKIVASYEAPKRCEIYDRKMKLHFEIISPAGVTPDKGNPLIKKLQEKLEAFVYEKGYIHARIIDVDDFEAEQRNPNLVVGRWDLIKWHVVDSNPNESERVYKYNNEILPELASRLEEFRFTHYNTTIHVTQIRLYN